MLLREFLNRTGEGKAAVVGWGRGMGHKGHMYLASSVITQAGEEGADPYFVVSRTVGKDDPITPEEKMQIYKKVFPKHGHIFHSATDEMPDLTRVLTKLDKHGYTDVTVVVGADQVKALSYVKQYNGVPNKAGETMYSFNSLNVISRQETNDPSKDEEGPRATPMRAVLTDPDATEEQKFQTWRDAMSPEISDAEVHELMNKAHERMQSFSKPKVRAKKEKVADEGIMSLLGKAAPAVKKPTSSLSSMRASTAADNVADALPPPHIRMYLQRIKDAKSKGIQPQFSASEYTTLQQWIKNQQVYGKTLETKTVKQVNKILREMRAHQFIKEGSSSGVVGKGGTKPIDKEMEAAMRNATTIPGLNMSTGSQYMNYRMGIALAGAPDYPTKMAADNWIGGDPLISSYTQEEYDMVKAAALQVGAGTIENWTGKRSEEMADVNKTSAVAKVKRNKYGI
jgi:hypothetical protein